MWKISELYAEIDLTKVAYFGNTQNKVWGLVCQLLHYFMFDLYLIN